MIAAPLALFALLAVSGGPDAAALAQEGTSHLRREFERVGRQAPRLDPALDAAARALAERAARAGPGPVADLATISQAVSAAGGIDPTPRAVVIRATPPGQALSSFLQRRDLNQEPASHAGVGAFVSGDQAVMVVLLTDRKIELRPFPRSFPRARKSAQLCGELHSGLQSADVYVTRPFGSVDKLKPTPAAGTSFCARVEFPSQGRHAVEVIGHGPNGPEVVALFFVDVGVAPREVTLGLPPEPTDLEDARTAIVARINALRGAQGAPPVAAEEHLNAVAQAYTQRLVKDRFFAHVSPEGEDLKVRLARAGYAYVHAGENLGLASGPLSAHFAIEHSPGHRKNLLTPDFTQVGVGVAWDKDQGGAVVVEVLALPTSAALALPPSEAAYRALLRFRSDDHLPRLKRSPALERIAAAHVRLALQQNSPRAEVAGKNVHDRVFDALAGVKSATVDVYVADDPAAIPRSKSVEDPRNEWVGVGALQGDSPTFGKGKFWVVVIYAASR